MALSCICSPSVPRGSPHTAHMDCLCLDIVLDLAPSRDDHSSDRSAVLWIGRVSCNTPFIMGSDSRRMYFASFNMHRVLSRRSVHELFEKLVARFQMRNCYSLMWSLNNGGYRNCYSLNNGGYRSVIYDYSSISWRGIMVHG